MRCNKVCTCCSSRGALVSRDLLYPVHSGRFMSTRLQVSACNDCSDRRGNPFHLQSSSTPAKKNCSEHQRISKEFYSVVRELQRVVVFHKTKIQFSWFISNHTVAFQWHKHTTNIKKRPLILELLGKSWILFLYKNFYRNIDVVSSFVFSSLRRVQFAKKSVPASYPWVCVAFNQIP